MPESGTKKQPSWLQRNLPDPTEEALENDRSKKAGNPRTATPTLSMSGTEKKPAGISSTDYLENARANPAPIVIALLAALVLGVFFWFAVLRDTGDSAEPQTSSEEVGDSGGRSITGAEQAPEDPFSGGAVRDTGVVFGALQLEEDGKAELNGAGLDWSGTVTEKEGGQGETLTLEGPTAAQLERGFDLGESSVETGVYAIAQRSGEVLHVSTHTYRPQGMGAEPAEDAGTAGEKTLGTVYALNNGSITGYAYYLDEREEGTDRVTRTYVRPGQKSYRVSFTAQPGTFVPLLVGWRGFEDTEQRTREGE